MKKESSEGECSC